MLNPETFSVTKKRNDDESLTLQSHSYRKMEYFFRFVKQALLGCGNEGKGSQFLILNLSKVILITPSFFCYAGSLIQCIK